jgi:nicotinamide phosphoribosyltransferase
MTTPFKLKSTPNVNTANQMFKLFAPHCLDSYKLGHINQYTPGTEYVYSNFTARSDRHLNVPRQFHDGKLVWYGMYGMLKDLVALWDETFFSQPKEEVLSKYAARTPAFTGADAVTTHLAALHDLGYLPIRVKSIREGSRVNIGVPLFTVVNTRKDFFWLTNALETHLSNEGWKAPTVATIAYTYRKILDHFAEKTGSPKDFVPWQGHCFADRGMSGMMDAAKNCSGHLIPFWGTDSVSSMDYTAWAYKGDETFQGGSVPATEHSVMCLGGKETEIDTFRRLLKTYPAGVVSIVSDTWDFWHVLTHIAVELKEEILARQPNAIGLSKVVFRPDSGNPADILCGLKWLEVSDLDCLNAHLVTSEEYGAVKYQGKFYEFEVELDKFEGYPSKITLGAEVPEHLIKGAVEILWDTFGGTMTDEGYKAVSQRVGLIYGDSITVNLCNEILERLEAKGFASCNVVLGIGSYTYQYITRDTLGFSMKATYGVVNGQGIELFKDPKTDNGVKKSAKGLLKVLKSQERGMDGWKYILVDQCDWDEEDTGELELVFEDGNFFVEPTLEEIRKRLLG